MSENFRSHFIAMNSELKTFHGQIKVAIETDSFLSVSNSMHIRIISFIYF